jgi:hypothetical protein
MSPPNMAYPISQVKRSSWLHVEESMNRKAFQIATWLLWLALPLTALRYWMLWDQLPSKVATHFNAAGHPNGWMTRETSLAFVLGLTTLLLLVFTVILLILQKKGLTEAIVSWALLGFSYFIIGLICYANESILQYNVYGRPVSVAPLLILTPGAVIAFLAVYLSSKRGHPLPPQRWFAQEEHGSKLWASVLLIPIVVESVAFARVPLLGIRIGLVLLFCVFGLIAIHAWTGFRYRFGPSGVEISTLGFRLRSIPSNQIKEYAEKQWSPIRGYGIRGIGHDRAYVWGNHGVLIKTFNGEVFLGHKEPERILRDLDAVKQHVHF